MDQTLIDSDALYALYNPEDVHHSLSVKIQKQLSSTLRFYITNLVFSETATVISHRISHTEAKWFVNDILKSDFNHIFVDEELTQRSWSIFTSQTRKGTSFIDCANIAVLKKLNLLTIFSFDKVYKINGFKRVGID